MIGTQEQDEFLRTHSLGVLTTLRSDGSPCNSVCFVVADGDELIFSTKNGRFSAKNIDHDPRVTITVMSEDDGCSYVTVDGIARFQRDGVARAQVAIGRVRPDYDRFSLADISEEALPQLEMLFKAQDRVIVRVTPERVIGVPDRALWRKQRDEGTWERRQGWPKDP